MANLKNAINDIRSKVKTFEISELYVVTEDLSVPTNVTLSFLDNGRIEIDHGVTLHIAGPLSSPPRQIFSGLGRVQFESGLVPRVYPQWWGAYSNGIQPAETHKAIKAAANSIHNPINPSMSQVLEFLPGLYAINDEIVLGSYANTITGSGTIIMQTDNSKKILNFNNAYMIRVSGLRFSGSTTPDLYLKSKSK